MGGVAKVVSVAPVGFEGNIVEVEADASNGLPSLQIVGMGSKAIDEARERVRSAIKNSMLEFPTKKLVVNLAPAELPKDGTHYDLPIALAILISGGQLQQVEVKSSVFAGELALDGSLRPIKGVISIVELAKRSGYSTAYIPIDNVPQARLIPDIEIIGVSNLKSLFLHLKKEIILPGNPPVIEESTKQQSNDYPLLDEVLGQEISKRALIIAAAGHHNILLKGSPGAGKTMLAKVLAQLMPPLNTADQIAVTKLHSLAGEAIDSIVRIRPFRSPHHTASRIALIGGGTRPRPGEISLAHNGVLFLDELPEYPRASLEALRQPLEDRQISISRANGYVTYPANFMLVATMNPCPCGYYGDSHKECTCSSSQIENYQRRLSGPLLDRIDLSINVPRVSNSELSSHKIINNLQHLQAIRVIKRAHDIQASRYRSSHKNNANLSTKEINHLIPLPSEAKTLLSQATDKLGLSARAYFKIIRIARTIADLDESSDIKTHHIAEALQYRINSP